MISAEHRIVTMDYVDFAQVCFLNFNIYRNVNYFIL